MSGARTVLGISAYYHDAAACLVRDGEIVAAAQEERFTRKKHDAAFPRHAIAYCLREAGIGPEAVDHVAFYDKPLLKFDRILETYLAFAPRGFGSFLKAIPLWLHEKLHLPRALDEGLAGAFKGRYIFSEHHESHAASAFYPSPFDEAAVLVMDGVGEWATATMGVGRGTTLELTHELRFPHSLGLLYSAFTSFAGFKVNSGEYKLMGLAPYGEPRYRDLLLEHVIDLKADGSFRLDLSYFDYCVGHTMTSPKLAELLGWAPRAPESPTTRREMDLAASIQAVTEEVVLRLTRHLARTTGQRNLVLAGGVALNCVANGRVLRDGAFERVWIQPAAGDAGGALGAALLVWHKLLGRPRVRDGRTDAQRGSLLGPRCEPAEIQATLERAGASFRRVTDEDALLDVIVDELAHERVVGFVQGRMEFGPRALGSRSILGDPRSPRMQSTMNLKIKFRESFRPFAPSVLREDAPAWFDVGADLDSPYMLVVAPVHADQRIPPGPEADGLEGVDLLKVPRSTIPAVTHVDGSARVQTVDARHGRFQRLLARFKARTGCPVLINTSFNVRGEPIVNTAEDAYRCFLACDMDVLVIEDFVLRKEDQPRRMDDAARAAHLATFGLD